MSQADDVVVTEGDHVCLLAQGRQDGRHVADESALVLAGGRRGTRLGLTGRITVFSTQMDPCPVPLEA